MANDSQRDKARAMFGAAFFENSKAQPLGKQTNSMQALQQRANARPIPTYKDGGQVRKPDMIAAKAGAKRAMKAEQDFSGLLGEAADRAARKGMPVMKQGGPTDEYTAKRLRARMEAGNYKDGGKVERYDAKIARKRADIEKDYQKALAKGKNADVAKAKYEQRMADAADDYAKWTKGDRTATKAAEKAAEKNLSMTRKSARNSPTGSGAKTSEALVKKAEESMSQPLSSTGPVPAQKISVSTSKAKAPVRKAAAPVRRAAASKVTGSASKVTGSASKSAASAPANAPVKNAPAAGVTATPAKAAPAKAAQKPRDPFAKDATGNYLDTSAAGSRARLAARFGLGGGKPSGAYGALAEIARKADAEKAKRKAAEEANARAKVGPVPRSLQADPYGYNKVGKYAAGGAGKVRKGQAPMKKGK